MVLATPKGEFIAGYVSWGRSWDLFAGDDKYVAVLFSRVEICKTITEPPKPSPPPEIKLRGDYRKLGDLLEQQQWKQADQETATVMLQVANGRSEGWLREEDIDYFPCEDLRTIDQLWVKYSGGRFGFSVQAKIYRKLGGTREYDEKIWNAFGDRVGWRVNNNWIYYRDVTFDLFSPLGHLPYLYLAKNDVSSLASRLVKCNI
ncbi:GUN4 domain-containing protein [Microcystis sp. M048S1]